MQRHLQKNTPNQKASKVDKAKDECEQSNSNLAKLSCFSSCSETWGEPSAYSSFPCSFTIPLLTISAISEERNTSNLNIVNSSSPKSDSDDEVESWSSSSGNNTSGESTLSGSGDTDVEAEEFLALELERVNPVLEEGGGKEIVLAEVVPELTQEDAQITLSTNNKEGSSGGGGRTAPFKSVKEIPNSDKPTTFTPVQKQRLKKLRKKMFRKLNCGRCADAVRGCCDDNGEYPRFFELVKCSGM